MLKIHTSGKLYLLPFQGRNPNSVEPAKIPALSFPVRTLCILPMSGLLLFFTAGFRGGHLTDKGTVWVRLTPGSKGVFLPARQIFPD